jgi:hypothetical protein
MPSMRSATPLFIGVRRRKILRTSSLRSSRKLALKMHPYGDLGSGSSQLV